jgi:hypothetical protein
MSPLSDDQLNEQAAGVAASALSDSVIAATRCEQVTSDMSAKAAGIGKTTRGMARFNRKLGGAVMPGVGGMAKGLEASGLPGSFILAVTKTQVCALEDKRDGDNLAAGKVLKSWDRDGFRATLGNPAMAGMSGIPEDRQELTLYLPLDGSSNKYLAAAGANLAAAGSPGMPTKFMIAKDAASQAVVNELTSGSPAAAVSFGGAMPAQAPASPPAGDSTEALERLAALHQSGALTDDEFAAQKAKIIGGG